MVCVTSCPAWVEVLVCESPFSPARKMPLCDMWWHRVVNISQAMHSFRRPQTREMILESEAGPYQFRKPGAKTHLRLARRYCVQRTRFRAKRDICKLFITQNGEVWKVDVSSVLETKLDAPEQPQR